MSGFGNGSSTWRAELLVDVAARPDQLEAVGRLGRQRGEPHGSRQRIGSRSREASGVEAVDPVVAFGARLLALDGLDAVVGAIAEIGEIGNLDDRIVRLRFDRRRRQRAGQIVGLVAFAHRRQAGGDIDRSDDRRHPLVEPRGLVPPDHVVGVGDLARREQRLGRTEVDRGGIGGRCRQRIAGRHLRRVGTVPAVGTRGMVPVRSGIDVRGCAASPTSRRTPRSSARR